MFRELTFRLGFLMQVGGPLWGGHGGERGGCIFVALWKVVKPLLEMTIDIAWLPTTLYVPLKHAVSQHAQIDLVFLTQTRPERAHPAYLPFRVTTRRPRASRSSRRRRTTWTASRTTQISRQPSRFVVDRRNCKLQH